MRSALFSAIIAVTVLSGCALQGSEKDIDLRAEGVCADGSMKVTARLQAAIDSVSASGGGRVILSEGVFLTGPIELKTGVELNIREGAVLLGSPDLSDYPDRQDARHYISENLPRWRNISLIYADEAENISITGKGTIDCNGRGFVRPKSDPDWTGWQYERCVSYEQSIPRAVFFAGCRNVKVKDVTMINQPAGWSYWVHDCDRVEFRSCRIYADVHYPNNDGIHINSSRDVKVSGCIIETGDDAIVLRANNRSLRQDKVCERVTVRDCVLRSWSSGVRIGWTCDGVIRNCRLSNLTIYDSSNAVSCYLPDMKWVASTNDYGREATLVENISFRNITMREIYGSAVYVNVGASPETMFAGVRNLSFRNVSCTCLELPYFCGREDASVENVSFRGCTFLKCPPEDFPGDARRHGAVLRGKPGKKVVGVGKILYRNSSFKEK